MGGNFKKLDQSSKTSSRPKKFMPYSTNVMNINQFADLQIEESENSLSETSGSLYIKFIKR